MSKASFSAFKACPCGTGVRFGLCCQPILLGQPAETALALMRSRYTAFVLQDAAYVQASWHPSTRPETLDLNQGPKTHWQGLSIVATQAGLASDNQGIVEFKARYSVQGQRYTLHEVSSFLRENGAWYYVAAENEI